MVLYGITLVPMMEELRYEDPTLLSSYYADDAVFYGSSRRSVVQLRLLMDQWPDWGYFPEPEKSLFIADKPEEKEAAKRESERLELNINYVDGGSYLGACLGPREEI